MTSVYFGKMPNSYFQFKQFRVEQGQTAMKVTTEACLFGSLIETEDTNRILDIGTGTGLLALMLAQKTKAGIDGIEINYEAHQQASENFANSPWSERLKAIYADIGEFKSDRKYDLIISNPPFFQDHQIGAKTDKNQALHNDSLSYQQLAVSIKQHLSAQGKAWVLLPAFPMSKLIHEMRALDFGLSSRIIIHNSPGKEGFREVACFQKGMHNVYQKEIYIRDTQKDYSPEFIELLKPYYLHL